jgi:hypothetical protein
MIVEEEGRRERGRVCQGCRYVAVLLNIAVQSVRQGLTACGTLLPL